MSVAAPESTAVAVGVARNRSSRRSTRLGPPSDPASDADVTPESGEATSAGARAVAGGAGSAHRAASSSRYSRSRRATVRRSKSGSGKFHDMRSTGPSAQHSRLSRVAAEPVPAAVARTSTGQSAAGRAGKRAKLKPAGLAVRGPPSAPDNSPARSRLLRSACRSLSSHARRSRSARATSGSSRSASHSRGSVSASGPTSRSTPSNRSSRPARATFTAMSRRPVHRTRQRTYAASSRWNSDTSCAAASRSRPVVRAASSAPWCCTSGPDGGASGSPSYGSRSGSPRPARRSAQ